MSDDFLIENKRVLTRLEKPAAWVEGFINRIATPQFNPFYHLGTLSIFLLLVLAVTGLYLTILYRPGTEVAYASVERISSNWFGLLMRSIHRYASDGLMLVILLHAFKNLATNRFWGSRWLAWVSGWMMVVFTWFIGVMGYWLVWDQRAQWLTEYLISIMKGPVAVTFLSTDIDASTFGAFVIVLFLHIFLPLGFILFVVMHVVRLARVQIWSPRWLMALCLVALTIVSLAVPTRSAAPADLTQMIHSVKLDALYLGFLALIDRWGSLPVLTLTGIVFGFFFLLPWIAPGKHRGPAVVTDASCTGCSLCAVECPFRAIEMRAREDEDASPYKLIALVNPQLCTGCGICVGTCATAGIELQQLPTKTIYQEGLLRQVLKQTGAGAKPKVVFTCQRQASSGSLRSVTGSKDSYQTSGIITCTLPCVGMVDPVWTKELFSKGVKEIAFVSCPYDDCANREGPHWLSARLNRRKALLTPALHWIESTPGDARPLEGLLARLEEGDQAVILPVLPQIKGRLRAKPRLPAAGLGLLALTLLIGLALPLDFSSGQRTTSQGQIRILIEHHGNIKAGLPGRGIQIPEHASLEASQILGGERYPVLLQVRVNSELVVNENHSPTGLRSEGKISGLDVLNLPPGEHEMEVLLKDDDGDWRVLFSDTIRLLPSEVRTMIYDEEKDAFTFR
jgi:ferredoxin/coenzyme F420-reducing hydrogenase delta subunit